MIALVAWLTRMPQERRQRADYLVLGVLTVHGELHGYALMKATALGPGRLYASLARLEHGGVIRSRWETAEEHDKRGAVSDARRRLYRLADPNTKETAHA